MSMFFGLNRTYSTEAETTENVFSVGSTLNNGLVGLWKLNEQEGTVAYDSTSNGYNGTHVNTLLDQSGVFDTSSHFNGTSSRVDLPNTSNYNFGDYNSLSVWFNIDNFDGGGDVDLIGFHNGSSNRFLLMVSRTEQKIVLHDDIDNSGLSTYGTTILEAGKWYHVVVTLDANNGKKIYLNGELDGSNSKTTTLGGLGDHTPYIGRHSVYNYFNGYISDVGIWNKVLSASEINELTHPYLPEKSFTEQSTLNSGLVAHYKNSNKNIHRLVDYSGNGHHGTIDGAVYANGVFGRSLVFDSSTPDGCVVKDRDELTPSGAFTLLARFKLSVLDSNSWIVDKKGEYRIFVEGDGNLNFDVFQTETPSEVFMRIQAPVGYITTDVWYTVVATYDGSGNRSGMSMSVNNVIPTLTLAQSSSITGIQNQGNDLVIGRFLDWDFFSTDGYIDEITLWSRVLTESEITELVSPYPSVAGFQNQSTLNACSLGLWKLNDQSGTTAVDSSSNGSDGTYYNTPTLKQPGVFDTCAEFDSASSEYVRLPNTNLDFEYNDAFSISAWVYKEGALSAVIISKMLSSGTYRGWAFWSESNGNITFALRNTLSLQIYARSNLSVSFDTWNHVLVTYDGSGLLSGVNIYINGVLSTLGSNSDTLSNNTIITSADSFIGVRDQTSLPFDGKISDVGIWNKVLSASEINELTHPYLPEKSFTEQSTLNSGLVAHYKNSNNNIHRLVDYSGNGYHGTIDGTSYEPSVFRYGLDFESDNSNNIALPDNPGLDWGNQVSIFARIKLESQKWQVILCREAVQGVDLNFLGINTSGQIRFHEASGIDVLSSNTLLSVRVWYDILVVKDGNSRKLYINGSLDSSNTTGVAPDNVDDIFHIGATISNNNRDYFDGVIDEVSIWNRPLTSDEALECSTNPYDKILTSSDTLDRNLVGLWKLNDQSGTTAVDSSVYEQHGTYYNTPTLKQPGVFDTCVEFDASSSEYVRLPNTNLDFEYNDAFSIAAWVNIDTLRMQGILFKCQDSGDYRGYGLWMESDGDITCRVRHDTNSRIYKRSSDSITTNKWHLIVFTYDGSTNSSGANIYIDGNKVTNWYAEVDTLGNDTIQNSINANIGARNDANSMAFDGKISDVGVWSKELTASEVNELAHPYLPENVFPTGSTLNAGLVAAYKLNEKYDLPVIDYSGNSNHGTNNGATIKQPGVFDTCFLFDSTNENVTTSSLSTLGLQSSDISFSFWFNPDVVNSEDYLIGSRDAESDGSTNFYVRINSNGTLTFRVETLSGTQFISITGGSISVGNWYHVVGIYNRTNKSGELFVNNSSIGNDSYTETSPVLDNHIIYIGDRNAARQYYGKLSDVSVWSKALTASEINELTHPYLPATSFPEQSTLNTGIVAHYKNSNNNIPRLVDYSGNGHHGSIENDSSYTESVYKYGFSLNGADQDLRTPLLSELGLTTGSFSVSVRFKADNLSGVQGLVGSRRNIHTHNVFVFRCDGSKLDFFVGTLGGDGVFDIANVGNLTAGEWHNAVAVYDEENENAYVYLDGVLVGSATSFLNPTMTLTDNQIYIGSRYYQEWFEGDIDEVIVWNKVLTSSEVTELQKPYPVFDYDSTLNTDLVAAYQFDEMEGTSLFDHSGNALHGVNGGASLLSEGMLSGDNAYTFVDSEDDNILVSDNDTLTPDQAFSILCLVKPNTLTGEYNTLFQKPYEYALHIYNDTVIFRIYQAGTSTYMGKIITYETTPIDSTSEYYAILATYNGVGNRGGMNIYVNNVNQTTGDQSSWSITGIGNTSNSLNIGGTVGNADFDVDKIYYWTKELSSDERTELDQFLNS